jgi:predicted TIM-barrel fold metal-dependent hydrolase
VYATYEEDELAARLLDRIGVDNIMWASDYPHGDSTWPRSREAIADSWLSTLAPDEQRKILFDNASRLYGIS